MSISLPENKVLQLTAFVIILVLCTLTFASNADHQFLHWDDITYITSNPWITSPSWTGVKEIFTQFRMLNWHPLTWLSYIPEYYWFGENAAVYKTTNIVLHSINSLLVCNVAVLLLACMLKCPVSNQIKLAGLLSGIVFAVHTQHAESIIWIAERKDLLCALFFLLSIICYLCQCNTKNKPGFLPFIFFFLAILSKPMAITLPAVLLLLDAYPLSRFKTTSLKSRLAIIIGEKLHYYGVSLVVVLITLLSQHVDAIEQPSLYQRLLLSASAVIHYLASFFYPVNLSPFYPAELVYYQSRFFSVLAVIALVLVSCFIWKKRAIFFWAYFAITITPVVGFVKVGDQAFADRYTYLPMIGFYIMLGYIVSTLLANFPRYRILVIAAIAALMLALIYNTHHYKNIWKSDLTLWQYVAGQYPAMSTTIYNNLGNSYYEKARFTDAIAQYQQGIDIDSRELKLYANLGRSYERLGNIKQSLAAYEKGIENNPGNVMAFIQAADAYYKQNEFKRAIEYYYRAFKLDQNHFYAQLGMGKASLITGNNQQAILFLNLVPVLSSAHYDAQLLLAQAYAKNDKTSAIKTLMEAEKHYGKSKIIDEIRAKIQQK